MGTASSAALGLDDVVVVALTFQSRPDWVVFIFLYKFGGGEKKIILDSNSSLGSNKKSCVPFFMATFFFTNSTHEKHACHPDQLKYFCQKLHLAVSTLVF